MVRTPFVLFCFESYFVLTTTQISLPGEALWLQLATLSLFNTLNHPTVNGIGGHIMHKWVMIF